jgi:Ser/Thr protein kinase RdoA (MazF antagonist)
VETLEPTEQAALFLISSFGLPYASGRLVSAARGSMGQIWRLELSEPAHAGVDDGRLMIKQFFWGASDDAECAARTEAELCRAAAADGLTVSSGHPTPDGRYLLRLPDQLGGAVVRAYDWVEGRDLTRSDVGRADYLGTTLGTLHRLRLPATTEPDPYFTTPPNKDNWDELVEITKVAHARIPDLAAALSDRIGRLRSLSALVDTDPQTDLITSHRDVKPGNVLFDPRTNVKTLVDWDETGPISPARELAAQLWVWHVNDEILDRQGIRDTMSAYRAAGGYADLDDLAVFSLRLANDLNYVHGQVLASLADDISQDMRQYAIGEARRFLGSLPTQEILEDILAVAAGA